MDIEYDDQGNVLRLMTDEARQAAAIDHAEDVVRRSMIQLHRNIMRKNTWRTRFHSATGIWPSYHTAYPTKGEK